MLVSIFLRERKLLMAGVGTEGKVFGGRDTYFPNSLTIRPTNGDPKTAVSRLE